MYDVPLRAALGGIRSPQRDDFVPGQSDVDLLVEFESLEPYALVDAYFGLLDELRSLLGAVDLVMVGAVKNPYIARAIRHGVGAASPCPARAGSWSANTPPMSATQHVARYQIRPPWSTRPA